MIAVHEIARDPQLKKVARHYFENYAVVSVVPTEQGQSKIDEMHAFYVRFLWRSGSLLHARGDKG